MSKLDAIVFRILFALLILSAFLVRVVAARHGLPYIYNYDEPITGGAALHIMTTGDFNPHQFNYGSLLIYLYALVDVFDFFRLMGRPDTAVSYLTSLKDIHAGVVGNDSEWLWAISHPSFYFWDRMTSVALGLFTIILTYRLATLVTGHRWAALVSVCLLSSLPIVVDHSAYTTPDGPVSCFVVGAVFFACLFDVRGNFSDLLWSLVFTGLTAATKYNDSLVIVVPAIALAFRRYKDPSGVALWWFLCLAAVPAAVFILIVPYSILDSVIFLGDVGFEIRHYSVLGHGENSSTPGFGQLLFQSRQFYKNLGLINILLAVIGLCSGLVLPRLRLALVFPVVYILYMLGVKVNFHRNYVPVYPFVALLVSAGVLVLSRLLPRYLTSRSKALALLPAQRVAGAAIALVLFSNVVSSWTRAAHENKDIDSRSSIIGAVNELAGNTPLIIPEALRIHPQDLARLRRPVTVASASEIVTCTTFPPNSLVMLPTAMAEDADGEPQVDEAAALDRMGAAAAKNGTSLVRIDGSPLYLNGPTRSPGLVVIPFTASLCRTARPT